MKAKRKILSRGRSARIGRSAPEDDVTSRNFVTALARGLGLLRSFTPDEPLLGNQELAAKTGLAKATVSRLTYTLAQLGYLKKQVASGKYHLDVGVLALGYQLLSNLTVRTIVRPYLEEFAAHVDDAVVAMAARDRMQMVYLDAVYSKNFTALTMRRQIGSYLPLHCTAMGLACLAATPDAERHKMLMDIRERHSENWTEIRKGFDRAFEFFAKHGFCISIGGWRPEVNSVAVPMVHKDHGILAFNCVAPAFLMPREKLEQHIGPRLKHMVGQIQDAIR
jgi:DNA-binding IclR family transcriptional regulator